MARTRQPVAERRETTVAGYSRRVRWDRLFKEALERGDAEEAIRIAVDQIQRNLRKTERAA
jgi:hypothetical protein